MAGRIAVAAFQAVFALVADAVFNIDIAVGTIVKGHQDFGIVVKAGITIVLFLAFLAQESA